MFILCHLPSLLPLQIQVTLEEFAHLELKPCKGCVYSSCLCASEAKTFQWSVTAGQLGKKNREVGWWNWKGVRPRWGCFVGADMEWGIIYPVNQRVLVYIHPNVMITLKSVLGGTESCRALIQFFIVNR